MATQTTALYDELTKWNVKDYRQYQAEHRYRGWIGKTPGSVIQRDDSLMPGGVSVRIGFTDDIGYRNIGTGTLDGNEATYGTDYYDLKPLWYREAVKVKKSEVKKAFTKQRDIARYQSRNWIKNMQYESIMDAFEAVAVDPAAYVEVGTPDGTTVASTQQVTFLDATEAQRDAFLTANADRVRVGNDGANLVAGDMSASLLNLDATDDLVSIRFLEKLKQLARQDDWRNGGSRPIRPVSAEETKGKAYFKVVMNQRVFEGISNDEDMKRYNTDARLRGVENHPLFDDGDLLYKGMIISEDVRLPVYTGLGAAGEDVSPVHLFGAQAIGNAVGQKYRYTKSDNRDYEFFDGYGVEEQCSFEKLFYQGGARAGKQHGMITGYVASPA